MKIGFTGTREGLHDHQHIALVRMLVECFKHNDDVEFHHGCCVGADDDAHLMLQHRFGDRIKFYGYPCNLSDYHGVTYKDDLCDVTFPIEKPLDRNKKIVKASNVLIACPKEHVRYSPWPKKGGTWYTVRYALDYRDKVNPTLEVIIIYPNGEYDTYESNKKTLPVV